MAKSMVESGDLTLSICADNNLSGGSSVEGNYGVRCPYDEIPFVVIPASSKENVISVNGKSPALLVGKPALVINNTNNTSSYAILSHVGSAEKGWTQVSLRCAINVGYSMYSLSNIGGYSGNFTIYIDPDAEVSYTRGMSADELNAKITEYGKKSFGNVSSTLGTTAYASAVSGNYTKKEDINWEYINYFIITIDRNSPTPDYKDLLKNKVSGVIIEAGYLFNSLHQRVSYRNPKLQSQCLLASQFKISWGLYCDCKARSIDEAKEELYQLSFCIRKYPPVLGMWVHFSLVKSTAINDGIVNTYRDELIRLGLKGKIGIIATNTELGKISWKDKHCKDWVLWIDDHVTNLSDVEQLLSPSFFSV